MCTRVDFGKNDLQNPYKNIDFCDFLRFFRSEKKSKFFFRQKVIFFDVDSINRLDIGIIAENILGKVFFSIFFLDFISPEPKNDDFPLSSAFDQNRKNRFFWKNRWWVKNMSVTKKNMKIKKKK